MSYFPMFIELQSRPCLVAGGGQIAFHKVKVLIDFGAQITVVAPEILPEIEEISGVDCQKRSFKEADLEGQELVVAATNDKKLNHRISLICRKKKIPVNVVDQPEECSFIFPAYIKEKEVVAAFSSGGQSPVITQYLKEQMRSVATPLLGEMASCLGCLRKNVQQSAKTNDAKKKIYREILMLSIEKDRIPTEEEIEQIINKYP